MKKLLAFLLLSLTVFTFGCNFDTVPTDGNISDGNDEGTVETEKNESEELYFNPECISGSTMIFAKYSRVQTDEINISLKIAHSLNFGFIFDSEDEIEEFNNSGLIRWIHYIDFNSDSIWGNINWAEPISQEMICSVDNFLSEDYNYWVVKDSSDWLTTDKFTIDLDDGVYFINYNIGVVTEDGKGDSSKFVWGEDFVQFYIEKSGKNYSVYSFSEWRGKRKE